MTERTDQPTQLPPMSPEAAAMERPLTEEPPATAADTFTADYWDDEARRCEVGRPSEQPPPPAAETSRTLADADEIRLRPCPFCGGTPRYGESTDGGVYIDCSTCLASTSLMYPLKCDVRPLLAEKWNHRQPVPVAAGGAGRGERRWGVVWNQPDGSLFISGVSDSKEHAEGSAKMALDMAIADARVVPVLVTVLEGEGGAAGEGGRAK